MTIKKAIGIFNSEHRNTADLNSKIQALSTLDLKIYHEILKNHKGFENLCEDNFSYDEKTSLSTELAAKEPFSEMYIWYLCMKNDILLNDTGSYNNHALLFSNAYSDFSDFINRNYSPIKKVGNFNI